MPAKIEPMLCPCGSENSLQNCCLPFIKGDRSPITAEQLLRARYTAFVQGDIDYILSTHHSKTRHEVNVDEIKKWSKDSKWMGLKILQKEAGEKNDDQGTITFCAQYQAEGKTVDHVENSLFERENGHWRFLDGRGVKPGPFRRAEPKVGRNDPCPCGSGKKHKKCCGARDIGGTGGASE